MGQFIDLGDFDPTPSPDTPPKVTYLDFREICGRGGMAVVWRAWHRIMNLDVAVKVLNPEFSDRPTDIENFRTEARVLACLQHPGFVRGYGAQCVDGRHFYLMDFINGYTLKALLARKSKISEADALSVIVSVADALGYAWKNFRTVHCDLKPENIMISADGTVKIMDLGLASETMFTEAKRVAASDETDELIGTPTYMSPEQIYADVELDCRTDIYSLGATAYQLVTGREIFPGLALEDIVLAHVDPDTAAPDPRIYAPGLSESFVRLLSGMLVKDRDGRISDWPSVIQWCNAVESEVEVPLVTSPSSLTVGNCP